MSDLGSILIVLGFFSLAIKGLILGLGLRHLVRSNNHKVSLGAIFSFVGAFIIIPFIISTALTFYYYKSGYYEGTTDSFDIRQLYLVATTNFVISLMMVLITLTMTGQWRMFSKADRDGWKSLVPILNLVKITQIAKKPASWVFLLFIPFINIIVYILLLSALAKTFNKDGLFALGLFFLPFIFFPILGFGDSKYIYAENEIVENDELNIEDHLVGNTGL